VETAAYIQNKGWTDNASIVKSYQGAEKLIGRDPSSLVVLPKAGDTVAERALYQRLGMPESADKYDMRVGLPKEAVINEAFTQRVQGAFHKAGLSSAQAAAVIGDYNAYAQQVQAQEQKDADLNYQSDKTALLREWGGGHERKINSAMTAATSLGFTKDMIDAVESKIGYAATMKHFATLGEKLGEANFHTGEVKTPGVLTPAEAKAEIASIDLDPSQKAALLDKMHPQHNVVKAKRSSLFAIAYPEQR
jgi:hypothetical protein